jgi:hypothetical protein
MRLGPRTPYGHGLEVEGTVVKEEMIDEEMMVCQWTERTLQAA